jgi:hypothetical protein
MARKTLRLKILECLPGLMRKFPQVIIVFMVNIGSIHHASISVENRARRWRDEE